MRVRNRPGAAEMLAARPEYVVQDPEAWKGRWSERFETITQFILKLVWEKVSSL